MVVPLKDKLLEPNIGKGQTYSYIYSETGHAFLKEDVVLALQEFYELILKQGVAGDLRAYQVNLLIKNMKQVFGDLK